MNDFIQGNHEEKFVKKPLPVGISDYRRASTEYYYVDKTMMIKEFIDERTFFEKTEEDTSIYFKDKKIWQCGEQYRSYQGKYPVIFLTFKDIKFGTWEDTFEQIRKLIMKEAYRHR